MVSTSVYQCERNLVQQIKMVNPIRIVLLLFIFHIAVWAVNDSQFAVKSSHRDANGVTLKTSGGTMRIEVCGDRVVHVVATTSNEIPAPKVPVLTQSCRANNLQVEIGKKDVRLSTTELRIVVDSSNGALSFLSKNGEPLLTEPSGGGKSFDVPSLAEAKTWQLQQTRSEERRVGKE